MPCKIDVFSGVLSIVSLVPQGIQGFFMNFQRFKVHCSHLLSGPARVRPALVIITDDILYQKSRVFAILPSALVPSVQLIRDRAEGYRPDTAIRFSVKGGTDSHGSSGASE